jgi:hypothetical protein
MNELCRDRAKASENGNAVVIGFEKFMGDEVVKDFKMAVGC